MKKRKKIKDKKKLNKIDKKPFPQEEQLKEKMKKLEELNILLKLNEKEKQVLDTTNDELDIEDNKEKEYQR